MGPIEFSQLGIAVIPILYRSKQPAVRWQQYQSSLPTEQQLAIWFRPGRSTNAAVVCGWKGLTVLDFDLLSHYLSWQAWAIAEGGTARHVAMDSYRVRTSRGMHVYLFVADTPRCSKFQWGDIKARGGYVLIPPSVHPSGAIYTAVDESSPILSIQELGEVVPDPPDPPAVRLPPLRNVYAASSLWPGTAVEQIREHVSILSFFPDAQATGSNRWYMAKCPFHQDRNPSMWIDTAKGICGCYSGCTPKPLDSINFYARVRGLDVKAAIRELAKGL